MKDYGNNLKVPASRQPMMADMCGTACNPPMPGMITSEEVAAPMNIPGMPMAQIQLDMPAFEPNDGNQKQPIVKQFNPMAQLGSGPEGNVKRPINQSKSRK